MPLDETTAISQNQPAVTPRPRDTVARWRGRRGTTSHRWTVTLARLLVFVVLIGLWEGLVRAGALDPYFVSSPWKVANFLSDYISSGDIWNNLRVTLQETLLGFAFGSIAGIAAGLALARLPTVDSVLDPFLTVANSLPRVALAPLFLLWFGIGMLSKVVLAVSLVFFILMINTRMGVRNVDTDLVTAGRLLGAKDRQLFQKVILPAAVPSIMAGLRLGVIYALLGVVVGEMIAAEAGIGQQLTYFSGVFNTDGVIGMLVILAAIAALLNGITVAVERRMLGWQQRGQL